MPKGGKTVISRIKVLFKVLKGPFKCAVENGLKVGKNVTFGSNINWGSEPYLITIKDNVSLSSNIMFLTHDGGSFAFRDKEGYKDVNKFGKIVVEERAFIGANVTIMPNVRIGKRSVVGAGAVVTKSVPDDCVVAGIPARIVCSTFEYAEKMKSSQAKLGWDAKNYKANKRDYLINRIPEPPVGNIDAK